MKTIRKNDSLKTLAKTIRKNDSQKLRKVAMNNNTREPQTITTAESARRMGVTPSTITKMKNLKTDHFRTGERGRPYLQDVETLAAQRERLTLRKGYAESGVAPVFACPTTSMDLGGHLELKNQHDAIGAALELLGDKQVPEGCFLTGAWEMKESNAERLADEGGYLLGVVGGFVFEVVQVVDYLGQIPYRKRKVFVVEPVTNPTTLASLKGFVPWMEQTPFEVLGDL